LRCWAHDPLGLFASPGPLTPAATAVIHPAPLDPGQPTTGVVAARAGEDPAGSSRSGSGLGELEGIRPYVLGDRLSLLHWPAKARYGTWFVRQFGADGASTVPLVLDDRAGVHRKAEFERLLSATLWALDDALEGGCPVQLHTLTGRSFSVEPTAEGRAEACLALAELQPTITRTDRHPVIPAGAVLLTTRTGAERLGGTSGPAAGGWTGGHRVGAAVGGARTVVV